MAKIAFHALFLTYAEEVPQLIPEPLADRQRAILTQLPITNPANKPAFKHGPPPLAPKDPPAKPAAKSPGARQTAQQ